VPLPRWPVTLPAVNWLLGVASDARLSQHMLLDFAGWRSGQWLEEVDLAWYLEFDEPTDEIFANIIRTKRDA
jgi:hypothetical protein